jgi:hypothetical protein
LIVFFAWSAPAALEARIPKEQAKLVLEQQEIYTRCVLGEQKSGERTYQFAVSLLAPARPSLTRETLTDYTVYGRIVPFVSEANYNPRTRILNLRGGIWGFHLNSHILFTPKTENWIEFDVVYGHFKGMRGELIFEPHAEKGTWVFLGGSHTAAEWPPRFVLEKGGEVALSLTARKLRSLLIERKSAPTLKGTHDKSIPQPRSGFSGSGL